MSHAFDNRLTLDLSFNVCLVCRQVAIAAGLSRRARLPVRVACIFVFAEFVMSVRYVDTLTALCSLRIIETAFWLRIK